MAETHALETQMTTTGAIAIGLAIYAIVTTAVSFVMMARVRKPADFLVAGRGLPFWVLAGTITGTCIGTGVMIGGSALAYKHGWGGCAYPIGLGLGTLLAGLFFAKMRRYRFMTLGEEVACYYGGNRIVVEFANITLFLSQVCWLTVQIMGGAAVLGAVTPLAPATCVLIAGFIKAIITIPGGLKAVVYTDVLQTTILFCGFGFLTHSALRATGGLTGLEQSVPPDYTSFLGIASLGGWKIVSLILVLGLSVIADPGRRLTMYSARSENAARWSMVASGVVVVIFSAIIAIAGMYAFRLKPDLPVADRALPWLVVNVLPPWLAALVVVAFVSGMSSAANGTAAAAGTFFVRHIYPLVTGHFPERPVVMSRYALSAVFGIATALALVTGSIVGFVVKFLPLTMSGLAIVLLLGRFWKRVTWQGAVAALVITPAIAGGLTILSSLAHPVISIDPTLPAACIGAIAAVAVSLLTPPTRTSFDQVAEALVRDRRQIEDGLTHGIGAPAEPAAATAQSARN
ncbi:MAG TPA: sodium:solute symporter family protein [Verrucomicrobiae bacterium]|nr:sodium:solute symporter family protein [Verrucomicrobiae bacterium]